MAGREKWDPRQSPRHRERGPAQLAPFTWQTIADLLGLSIHTAKKYGTGPGRKFNPHDVADVVRYLRERGGGG